APAGANRSDVFHTIVGHFVGCGWQVDRILEHLQEHPQGIGGRYIAEDRLRREIDRSAKKFEKAELTLFEAKAPEPETRRRKKPDDDLDDDLDAENNGLDDDDLGAGNEDDDDLRQDPNLPRLHTHGDADPRPLKAWLIKHLIPQIGHGLMSGQWGAGKTFAF